MELVNPTAVGMGRSHLVSVKTSFDFTDLGRLRKAIDNHLDFEDAVTFALLGASENLADRYTRFRRYKGAVLNYSEG